MINSIKKTHWTVKNLWKRCKNFGIIAVSSWWIRDWWLFWMPSLVEHDILNEKKWIFKSFQSAMGHPVTPCDLTSFFFDVFYIVSLHVFVKTLMNYHTHLHHHHVVSMRKLKRSWQKSKTLLFKKNNERKKKNSNKLKHDYDDSYFV